MAKKSSVNLLDDPAPEAHLVQLYGTDDSVLARNVARYLAEGVRRGDGLLVIASAQHRGSFTRALRDVAGYSRAVLEGRLVFLDAEKTLARFMVAGQPDRARFTALLGQALDRVRAHAWHGRVRAYGEMVGELWSQGQYDAALQLEDLWNRLLASSDVSLFCGYPITSSNAECGQELVASVLCAHTGWIDDSPES